MRPDRPLVGAVVCLVTGVALIVGYCHGSTGVNLAYPFTGSNLHVDLTTSGPGVPGGLLLLAIGILFLAWSLLAAIVSQISLLFHRDDRMESIVDRYRAPLFEADSYPESVRLTEDKNQG
jgi:hypothetical protein